MRKTLLLDDFEDPAARDLFIILEECYREDAISHGNVLAKCSDENLKNIVARAVASGEYSENPERAIEDAIKLIKRNSLEKKRRHLMNKIRQFSVITPDDQKQLDELISEKMNIDFQLNQKDMH